MSEREPEVVDKLLSLHRDRKWRSRSGMVWSWLDRPQSPLLGKWRGDDEENHLYTTTMMGEEPDEKWGPFTEIIEEKKRVGLKQKYLVFKLNDETGEITAVNDPVFVLKYASDKHAKEALQTYIDSCLSEYPELANDLNKEIGKYWAECECVEPACQWCPIHGETSQAEDLREKYEDELRAEYEDEMRVKYEREQSERAEAFEEVMKKYED